MKKRMYEKLKKTALRGIAFMPLLSYSTVCNAGGLASSKLVTGFQNLMKDGSSVLVGLEVLVLIVVIILEGIKWQQGAEEEAPKHKKKMTSSIGIGILIICTTALVPILFSYFQ